MAFSELHVLALGAATLLSVGTGLGALRRRSQRGALALAGFLFSATLWSVGILGTVLAPDRWLAFVCYRLTFVAMAGVAVSLFVFALRFCDRRDAVSFRTLVVLLLEPALFLGFLATAPGYDMVWTDVSRTSAGSFSTTIGPLLWAHLGYSIILALAGVAVMLRRAVRARGIDTTEFSLVVVALVVPFVTAGIDLLSATGVHVTPVAVAVTGAVLFVTMDRSDLMARTPVVRDALVETVDDAMVVLDGDRIIDHNTAFATFADESNPRGEHVEDALDAHPELAVAVRARNEEVVEVESDSGTRHLEVSVSSVTDHTGSRVGDLILFHDVTSQQRQQRELRRQNEQLDQFASLISHDLRNPLDVAIGRTTAIDEIADDPRLDEHVSALQDAHGRMQKIIRDVLTLARQGQSIDEQYPVSVADIAEDAWAHVETDDATLAVETDLTVRGDGDRLKQVFENLFRNAVEHAAGDARDGEDVDRNPTLTVTVGELPDAPGFVVEDDGPGIPDEHREEIFEAGYTEGGDGTGLGLAIVASIAEAHGWQVRATESDDGGARFEFTGVDVVEHETAPAADG